MDAYDNRWQDPMTLQMARARYPDVYPDYADFYRAHSVPRGGTGERAASGASSGHAAAASSGAQQATSATEEPAAQRQRSWLYTYPDLHTPCCREDLDSVS